MGDVVTSHWVTSRAATHASFNIGKFETLELHDRRTYPDPDLDFDRMSLEEIRLFITETDNQMAFARDHGADKLFVIGLSHQRNRAQAELKRRTNGHDPHANAGVYDENAAILTTAGFDGVTEIHR